MQQRRFDAQICPLCFSPATSVVGVLWLDDCYSFFSDVLLSASMTFLSGSADSVNSLKNNLVSR